MSNGKLIVISGFSGAGKSSIAVGLVKKHPEQYVLSISACTREKRTGEVEGESYFFVSEDKFKQMIKNNEFLEYANYVNHFYGTPKAYVDKMINSGKDVILEIETQGASQIKKIYPNAILVFVITKDAKTLYDRIVSRRTNSVNDIKNRLTFALNEAEAAKSYDYLIINEDINDSIDKLHNIINNSTQESKIEFNKDKLNKIKNELRGIIND